MTPLRKSILPMLGAAVAVTALAFSAAAFATDHAATTAATPGPLTWGPRMAFPDANGRIGIAYAGAPVDPATHPFFKVLGTNGRACVTCHAPSDGMSLSLATIKARWAKAGAQDPTFAAFDGSNCPSLDQRLESSHSLILSRGVFRIPMPWPPKNAAGQPVTPEFSIEVVNDPTGCNTSPVYGLKSAHPQISVFRRPRMTANFRYVLGPMHESNTKTMLPLDRDPETGVHVSMTMMSDAREPTLKSQARNAALGHMQAKAPPTEAQLADIVKFEQGIYVAQDVSNGAGDLTAPGGPKALGAANMRDGRDHINGNDYDTGVFFFFDEWGPKGGGPGLTGSRKDQAAQAAFRASVFRGNDIFFNKPFWISDVVGINNIRLGNPIKQTCAFCHDTRMTGADDVPGWMDLGSVNFPNAEPNSDLPMFKITCRSDVNPHPYLGRVIYTNDPGRALYSGKCVDVGGIVMSQMRGMSARAPYFVNGGQGSLRDIVDFYERRFNIGLSDQEKQDLVNFLSVL